MPLNNNLLAKCHPWADVTIALISLAFWVNDITYTRLHCQCYVCVCSEFVRNDVRWYQLTMSMLNTTGEWHSGVVEMKMWLQRRAMSLLVVGLMVAAAVTAAPSTDTLHYAVREEIAVGSVIADIVTDAGLHVYGVEVCAALRLRQFMIRFTSVTTVMLSSRFVRLQCVCVCVCVGSQKGII